MFVATTRSAPRWEIDLAISSVKTEELVYLDAISLAVSKIENKLNQGEFIKIYKVINKKLNDKGIELRIFFSVVEDITEYVEIGD